MRILFLTQDDPLYIQPFFESFFAEASVNIDVCGVWACRSMGSRKRLRLAAELLRLYQLHGFVKLLSLQLRARLESHLPGHQSASIAGLCEINHIPFRRIGNPNQFGISREIADLHVDVLVSVACPYILRKSVLCLPRLDAINLHQAPLPRYRGMMPTFWQMYHGERTIGVTVHRISELLDEGPVLSRDALPISGNDSMHDLIRRSKRKGAAAVHAVLQRIDAGGAFPLPALPLEPTSFTFPTAEEITEFHRRKLKAI